MGKISLILLLTTMSNACSGDNSDEINSEVALANNQFSIDMHNKLPSGENNFISGLCILSAFEMVALGAKGPTLSEMDTAFHLSEIKSKSSNPRAVDEILKKMIETYGKTNSNYSLSLANRLFAQENYDIKQEYVDETKEYYDASVEKVNFGSGAEDIINNWVENKTNDKIKDLFPPGSLSDGTRLTLVSAIYFKGDWVSPFDEKLTIDGDFYVSDNDVKKVKMMQKTARFPYVSDSELKIKVISLPYAGNDISMIVILPDERNGITQVMSKLTAQKLKELIAKLRSTKTNLQFPKLQLTKKYSLNEVLNQLGINQLFTKSADLSGISDEPSLQVTSAVHQSYIDINEKGTEAAAATGISVGITSVIVEDIVDFVVNHPYMFTIVDKRFDNSMLFTGVIYSP